VMKQVSEHKMSKELKRAERHKEWLRKNLPNTKMEKDNQKKLLVLYTNLRTYQT
jgi:hypothetical protein